MGFTLGELRSGNARDIAAAVAVLTLATTGSEWRRGGRWVHCCACLPWCAGASHCPPLIFHPTLPRCDSSNPLRLCQ